LPCLLDLGPNTSPQLPCPLRSVAVVLQERDLGRIPGGVIEAINGPVVGDPGPIFAFKPSGVRDATEGVIKNPL
jgi:hypothetical protein